MVRRPNTIVLAVPATSTGLWPRLSIWSEHEYARSYLSQLIAGILESSLKWPVWGGV